MSNWYFLSAVLILISIPVVLTFADSSRAIITVEEDVFVDESDFFNPEFHSQSLFAGFPAIRIELFDETTRIVSSSSTLPIISYLKFDLTSVPSSDLFETVDIDDAKLRLFFVSPDDSDAKMYVFTVSYCKDNGWTEKKLTWNTRPCKNNLQPVDTIIIHEKDIPGLIELDVIGAIDRIKEGKNSKITLVLDARPILFEVDYSSSKIGAVNEYIENNWEKIQLTDFSIDSETLTNDTFQGSVDKEFGGIWGGYLTQDLLYMKDIVVNFTDNELQSMDYSVKNSHMLRLSSGDAEKSGYATAPTIIIDYSVMPSTLNDSLIFSMTVVLPTIAVVFPMFIWFYKKSKD